MQPLDSEIHSPFRFAAQEILAKLRGSWTGIQQQRAYCPNGSILYACHDQLSYFYITESNKDTAQVSIVSILNSVQAYATLSYTRQIYKAQPTEVTGLSGRTFGTWTAMASIVRLYASLNIHDPRFYQLAIATYGIAWLHFVSEWLIFKTAGWGKGLGAPVFVSTGSLIWMFSVWGSYVQ